MAVSIFDLFKVGIGPSSSHTVGPMRAAALFATQWLDGRGNLEQCVRVRCELFGSLAHTGRGHGTNRAVILGLEGASPDTVDGDGLQSRLQAIRRTDPSSCSVDAASPSTRKMIWPSTSVRSCPITPTACASPPSIWMERAGHARLLLGRRRLRGQRERSGRRPDRGGCNASTQSLRECG